MGDLIPLKLDVNKFQSQLIKYRDQERKEIEQSLREKEGGMKAGIGTAVHSALTKVINSLNESLVNDGDETEEGTHL